MQQLNRKSRSWTCQQWEYFSTHVCQLLDKTENDEKKWQIIADAAWRVLRRYSTSFFLVTRFLPIEKRRAVEVIYAAVRYPDEVVDTFTSPPSIKHELLSKWRNAYIKACTHCSLRESINAGIAPFVSGFAEVVRRHNIPTDYYHAFLDAMEYDIAPQPFETMDDLIGNYIYGSAIVVGYFLTYVYGTSPGASLSQALEGARSLGIALQLTNFLRDLQEDHQRYRCYVPRQFLQQAGLTYREFLERVDQQATQLIVDQYAEMAWRHYSHARSLLNCFDSTCIPAIAACMNVYEKLTRILQHNSDIRKRRSVPMLRKFQCLPPSKYWIIPISYITPHYKP